jgi:hypothetical protein
MSTEEIKILNDAARRSFFGCQILVTQGVQSLGNLVGVLEAVRSYSTFDETNDPYGEHDFGSFTIDGQLLFWKIDYYDIDLQMASPDPTDPAVTARVLTIMLAEEY